MCWGDRGTEIYNSLTFGGYKRTEIESKLDAWDYKGQKYTKQSLKLLMIFYSSQEEI